MWICKYLQVLNHSLKWSMLFALSYASFLSLQLGDEGILRYLNISLLRTSHRRINLAGRVHHFRDLSGYVLQYFSASLAFGGKEHYIVPSEPVFLRSTLTPILSNVRSFFDGFQTIEQSYGETIPYISLVFCLKHFRVLLKEFCLELEESQFATKFPGHVTKCFAIHRMIRLLEIYKIQNHYFCHVVVIHTND